MVMAGMLILGSALYIWSGSYNIAATDPHFELVHRGLATIRDRSIAVRAGETEVHRVETGYGRVPTVSWYVQRLSLSAGTRGESYSTRA